MADTLDGLTSEAIVRAQVARLNLSGLLIAHEIPPAALNLLLKFPAAVDRAIAEQRNMLIDVAWLLALEHGVENWAAYPLKGNGFPPEARTYVSR